MSTRAIIKIEGVDYANIYQHYDGYPENTLKYLVAFNKDFKENRGDDPQYKFAQFLRFTVRESEKYQIDNSKYTGWGVIPVNTDYGQEYEYLLKRDGTVTYTEV